MDCCDELNRAVHLLLGEKGYKAPDYCGDDMLAMRALMRYRKRGVATGVYCGDLAAAMDPNKAEPYDCHLFRDRSHLKLAAVRVMASASSQALAICRALVVMEKERKAAEAW